MRRTGLHSSEFSLRALGAATAKPPNGTRRREGVILDGTELALFFAGSFGNVSFLEPGRPTTQFRMHSEGVFSQPLHNLRHDEAHHCANLMPQSIRAKHEGKPAGSSAKFPKVSFAG